MPAPALAWKTAVAVDLLAPLIIGAAVIAVLIVMWWWGGHAGSE